MRFCLTIEVYLLPVLPFSTFSSKCSSRESPNLCLRFSMLDFLGLTTSEDVVSARYLGLGRSTPKTVSGEDASPRGTRIEEAGIGREEDWAADDRR